MINIKEIMKVLSAEAFSKHGLNPTVQVLLILQLHVTCFRHKTAFLIEGLWVPEDNMKERVKRDQVLYDRWVNQKHLHATPGNVVDYDFVEKGISPLHVELFLACRIIFLGGDI